MESSQRKSILCPNCRKLISVDEPRCPYCGISNPGSRWKNNLWTRGFQNPDQLLKGIIYANIGIYIISLLINPGFAAFSLNPFAFLSPTNDSLLLLGATGTIPIDRLNRWWTLISANYLHGGILHILFNMIALKQITPFVISEYGVYRMFILYTLGGVTGFWISYLAGVTFTIGASAAVCGLIGAALYYGKSRGGNYGQAIYRQLGGWVIIIFLFGFFFPGINNWGHGGGILGGIVFGSLLGYQDKKPENQYHKIFSGVCMILTTMIVGWAVSTGIYYRFFG